ncbi:MAG: FkbM family methyltransferase [Brevundimonas sp.]|uniref:FkbM family methyltransferase n=1 Tax=Brevundimonas sp. TaxID=1871086 RepID=UPI001A33D8A8|nr:FkbM family methyltransferase [Brevundimonas sp.]MBJ7318579.1 FkbM family methyltransferase [Brevundimonas sp.]
MSQSLDAEVIRLDADNQERRALYDKVRHLDYDVATIEDIAYCFRLILGRAPNPEEWPGHTSMAGGRLPDVVRSYLHSAEFSNRKLMASEEADKLIRTEYPDFQIYTSPDDLSVGAFVAAGSYEDHVQSVFRHYLSSGSCVLDVGANIGFFSILAASIVGPSGHVIAIEPNRRNVRLLEASRRANDFNQIEIHNVAAHTHAGILVLNTSYSNGTVSDLSDDLASLMLSEIVPAQPIDAIVGDRRIDFLKIDVEGAELRALKGAHRVISRDHPVIVSEYSHTGIHEGGDAYLTWLVGQGYELAVIDGHGVGEFSQDKRVIVDAFERSGVHHIDILARPSA